MLQPILAPLHKLIHFLSTRSGIDAEEQQQMAERSNFLVFKWALLLHDLSEGVGCEGCIDEVMAVEGAEELVPGCVSEIGVIYLCAEGGRN
jgi:hypothetical protein